MRSTRSASTQPISRLPHGLFRHAPAGRGKGTRDIGGPRHMQSINALKHLH